MKCCGVRIRQHRIIFTTSLVWLLLYVILLGFRYMHKDHYANLVTPAKLQEYSSKSTIESSKIPDAGIHENWIEQKTEGATSRVIIADLKNFENQIEIDVQNTEGATSTVIIKQVAKNIENQIEIEVQKTEGTTIKVEDVKTIENQFEIEMHKTENIMKYDNSKLKRWNPAIIHVPPISGHPGEAGAAVQVPREQQDLAKSNFKLNQFNLVASDLMLLNRSLPDYRINECTKIKYPELLPTTSIVIVFHNEAWSTLLRTVWSIINRSPRELLEEIILVDDASERDFLGEPLEKYVITLPIPTYVLRTGNRSGLIRARLMGAQASEGQTITFLDSHCECTDGWLEPLLARVAENRKTVVCPDIDKISDETFEYIKSKNETYGGFTWKLTFGWYSLPLREKRRRGLNHTSPIRSPTMAGGLFTIDREYFFELGSYDAGMNIWGGENLEMSFRIWQCGGTLEILPCSRVGHVFRKISPHTFPGGVTKVINHNLLRVATVWMDDWKDFVFAYRSNFKKLYVGDISSRIELRERLKCKSFNWYLENIYPDSQLPLDYYYLGDIKNVDTGYCLDTLGNKKGGNIGMYKCTYQAGNQLFLLTKRNEIINNDACLDGSLGRLKLEQCHGLGWNQGWKYNKNDKTIRQISSKLCLERPEASNSTLPIMKPCDPFKVTQQWLMNNKFVWQTPTHKELYK